MMPNIRGFRPLANPEWISIEFDDGTISNPVNDPTGEYRAQVDEIAKKIAGVPPDPMAGAVASAAGALTEGAGSAMVRADVPAPLMAGPRTGAVAVEAPPAPGAAPAAGDAGLVRSALKTALKPQPEPTMPGGDAAAPGVQPSGSAPAPSPARASSPPIVTTGTTSQWQKTENTQRSSTGIADADRPGVQAANEASVKAAETANESDFAARANQLWSEWGRLSEQEKRKIAERSALQEQERKYDEALSRAYRKYDEDAMRPIDPAQAFAGEKGWYAFMAGFGDVLRNVGAALAGRGPVADPGATIDGLVERSVNLQMAQKEQDLKAGRLNIDRFTADRETVRHRLGVVLSQLAQNELNKAHTQQEYQALGALKAKGDAIVADARAKGAAALARQETVGSTTSTTSGSTVQKGIAPMGGAGGLNAISKMLDIEKKRLELSNAELDRQDADSISATIGKRVSPARAKELRDAVKQIDPQMAKLDSTLQALKAQLDINGATFDRNTGKIVWPKDVSGVSAIRWTDIPFPGGENITTDASRLDAQQAFLKELVTTDTTGAVASAQQLPAFQTVVGGGKHNETQYKESLENFARYLVERRNGYLAPLGADGIKLYRHIEQQARQGLAPSAKPIGTLPGGQR